MGIGKRFLQRFTGDPALAGSDPAAMTEAGVVLLAEGPMLVERLRDQGVEAVGIESVDPVTGVRSYMRIMVRQSDLGLTRRVLEHSGDEASAGEALDSLIGGDRDEGDAAAEEAAQQNMSQLFLAADRLGGRPGDRELVAEIARLRAAVVDSPPPFGVEPLAWTRVASLSAALVSADDGADEEQVRRAAQALRDCLREYV